MLNVVLYEPEIPGNTGNIMRTCAGTNVRLHLIEPLGFKLDESHIKRSGVNYIEHCNYKVYTDFEEFLKKNKGTYYYLTRYGKKPHDSFNYSNVDEDIYFIFGKESTGIPKSILKNHLDHCMRLPMNGKIRSLNLSNSVAIMIYEALRQRNYCGLSLTETFKGENYLENIDIN